MTITTRDIHLATGLRYSWISKHFKNIALDCYHLSGHAQYNVFNIIDIIASIDSYSTKCKNQQQVQKSYEMMETLRKALNEHN